MPKDACYYKVKRQYKVFPSAYASGAIAKCRKKKAGGSRKKGGTIYRKGGMVKSCCCNMERFGKQMD
tara:strand:- start:979 stop:1179 length:201 start_codon:yes stop_codon:yes gene_type:complete